MAIGLSNVETRKVKKPAAKKAEAGKPEAARPVAKSRMATTLIENSAKVLNTLADDTVKQPTSKTATTATAQAAPLKERKEKNASSGELNSLWLEWSNRVAGVEPESFAIFVARQWMELERLVFDLVTENVLKELRKTAFGLKIASTLESRVGSTK